MIASAKYFPHEKISCCNGLKTTNLSCLGNNDLIIAKRIAKKYRNDLPTISCGHMQHATGLVETPCTVAFATVTLNSSKCLYLSFCFKSILTRGALLCEGWEIPVLPDLDNASVGGQNLAYLSWDCISFCPCVMHLRYKKGLSMRLKSLPYTFKRYGNYYIQIRLSNGRSYKKSLSTDSYREASALMISIIPHIPFVKSLATPLPVFESF